MFRFFLWQCESKKRPAEVKKYICVGVCWSEAREPLRLMITLHWTPAKPYSGNEPQTTVTSHRDHLYLSLWSISPQGSEKRTVSGPQTETED